MTTDLVAFNPRTGEVLEHLEQLSPGDLAEALDAVRDFAAKVKRADAALEGEARRRLRQTPSKRGVWGDYELELKPSWRSEWDVEALEGVMRDLADQGAINAADHTEVIVRTTEVARSKADRLARQLSGDAHDAVEACRTWREQRGTLVMERSVQLVPPPEVEGALSGHDDHAPVTEQAQAGLPRPAPTTHEELFA